eukprot:2059326-Prymnesium_polylepis.1
MRQRHVYTGRAGRHTAHTRASALDTSVRPPIRSTTCTAARPQPHNHRSRATGGDGRSPGWVR